MQNINKFIFATSTVIALAAGVFVAGGVPLPAQFCQAPFTVTAANNQ